MNDRHDLARFVREVPDFPKPGILFRDITPLLADARAFARATEALAGFAPAGVDAVAGMEARGFIFGVAVAARLSLPFIPIRKAGKLPLETVSASYRLEYGESSAQAHADALARCTKVGTKVGAKVLLADDLIATGGTLRACAEVIEQLGAEAVMAACLIELKGLGGREQYARPLTTVLQY